MATNLFNVVLHGTTNGSTYLITSTEALNPQSNRIWLVEGSLQGGTNDATPFALGIATRTNNQLFIRAQACDECATTTLPLWYQLANFGVTGVDPNADYDGDGVNNLQEYLGGTDPNKISFSVLFDSLRVSGNSAAATITVLKGVPVQMAVLVDNTNFVLANWTGYSPTVPVDLGSVEGPHAVWIGLKGRATDSVTTWEGFQLTRDTAAPTIFITSPSTPTVSRPVLQLQGYSLEPLASVRYDVANDAGTLTSLEGYITRQWFDTNLLAFTTNWFECLDIQLTNGANTITLYATDRAGNVSTSVLSYTLDYSGVTSGPALTLYWPQDGAQVSGSTFTLRGLLDDPTATVTAQITDANGVTSQAGGLVERNGLLWVENLPLGPGTNTLALMMTNAAGLSSSTSLTVIQSDMVLTIDDLSATDLNQPTIFVSGTINTNDYTVWVNGMQVTTVWPNGNGTYGWQVDGVPVNDGGTAVIQARAIPNTDLESYGTGGSGGASSTMENPGNPSSPQARDAEADPDKAPVVVKTHYDITRSDVIIYPGPGAEPSTDLQGILYNLGEPGNAFSSLCRPNGTDEYFYWNDWSWDKNEAGFSYSGVERGTNVCGFKGVPAYGPCTAQHGGSEFCEVSAAGDVCDGSAPLLHCTRSRQAHTRYELQTGGKGLSDRQNLFVGSAPDTKGIGNVFYPEVDSYDPQNYPIAFTSIELGGFGRLGNDGRVYKVLADNTTMDITPVVQGSPYYTFGDPGATKHRLNISANSQDCEPEISPITPKFIVGQFVPFSSYWDETSPYNGSPPGLLPTTNLWTLAGNYYNDGTNSVPGVSWFTCSTNYFVNSTLLTSNSTTAWWVSGGTDSPDSYPVKLDEGLFFSNGQHIVLNEEGTIKMWRPRGRISPLTTSVVIYQGRLKFTDPINQREGITFYNTISIPVGFSGIRKWVQVASSRVRTLEDVNSVVHRETQTGAAPYGDTPIPYNSFDATGTIPGDSPQTVSLSGGYVRAEASNSFEMWMMFEPPGGMWVPLRAVNWSWIGSATNGPDGWAVESGTNSIDPHDFETEEYPAWKSNIRNREWIPPL